MGRRGLAVTLAALAVSAALGVLGPSAANASWGLVQVRVVTFHYTTHDGHRRAAFVVLPDWYGPDNNPPLPLIISPPECLVTWPNTRSQAGTSSG